MNQRLFLVAALMLCACSRNPDPEYAPDNDAAAPASTVETPAAVAPAPAPAGLSDDDAMRLGREAAALLLAQDVDALWPRFDAAVQAQAQSPENFGGMMAQVFGQIGAEERIVEEVIERNEQQPGLAIYRRRGHYMGIAQDANLVIAFNADGTIAGVNFIPAQ